ncbi:MAG: sulfotransferase family 2 domain-containing protein [Paracoccaceae bacterium]|nr:sulfotransferase family 2 domain-containing protein [Paracoccaceae bacterium]
MISHTHQVIYVHLPKTAGTSVKSLFADNEKYRFDKGVLDPNWSAPEFDGYYRFSVVRNPYDRFVSGWKYCASTRNRPILDVLRHLPQADLAAALRTPGLSAMARRAYTREYRGYRALYYSRLLRHKLGLIPYKPFNASHDYQHVTRQQHELLFDASGRLAVDRVVFFERLAEGLADVFSDLGRPLPDLPHARRNPRRSDYASYFDAETRTLFEEKFAGDLGRFRYRFDTPQSEFGVASLTREAYRETGPARGAGP